ncbi:MAG: DUF1574 family protein [Candidatus Brocadiales bacterium]|nr:DUF1574 family protein [Candidatus Brocadiales bacterium]
MSFLAFFNYLIDPYGSFGTDILNVNPVDSRSEILNKLDSADPQLQTLLFGSSRSLLFKHFPGLNVALYAGAIEDHYSILRYAVDDLQYPIKAVVLVLEPDLMVSSHPVEKMLVKNSKLNRWLIKEPILYGQSLFAPPGYIDDIAMLLSVTTLKNSTKVLLKALKKRMSNGDKSDQDIGVVGAKNNHVLGRIAEARDSIDARLRQYRKLYMSALALDKTRIKYLDMFAEFASENNIKVILVHPGSSKVFWDEMMSLSNFKNINSEFYDLIQKVRVRYGWTEIDIRPGKWKGLPLEYPDGVHLSKPSAAIIDNEINEGLRNVF